MTQSGQIDQPSLENTERILVGTNQSGYILQYSIELLPGAVLILCSYWAGSQGSDYNVWRHLLYIGWLVQTKVGTNHN